MDVLNSARLSDEEIAGLAQSGKQVYFGVLIKRYEEKILRYAKKFLFGYEEVEDLTQEVFVKAFINIQSFNPAKNFSSWLYRIAHNEFINAIKKKKREPLSFFDFDVLFPHPTAKEKTDKEALGNEAGRIIDEYLDQLAPKYREPLVLYYLEELNYKEIADVLRIPISTVGVRIRRAKGKIQKLYDTGNQEGNR